MERRVSRCSSSPKRSTPTRCKDRDTTALERRRIGQVDLVRNLMHKSFTHNGRISESALMLTCQAVPARFGALCILARNAATTEKASVGVVSESHTIARTDLAHLGTNFRYDTDGFVSLRRRCG